MNWRRWIRPGIVVTILVTLIAIVARNGAIGRDLGAAVTAKLAAEGQTWATVETSARDVTIRGIAPTPESQQAALRVAADVRGVRAVADGSDLLPIVSPYAWTARKTGRAVALSGSIPSETYRAVVLAAARRAMPDGEIADRMTAARGAPAAFNAATAFALQRIAGLAEGTVSLTDSTLTVTGTAATPAAYAAMRTALRQGVPAGIVLGPVDMLPARADPFVWSASFDARSVSLEGYVPNEVVHESLVAATKARLPGLPVDDRISVASGEPAGFAEAASFAIAALDRLREGCVTLDGLRLDVSGAAKSVDDYEALLATLSGPLPAGLTVVAIEVKPATVTAYGWRGEKADNRVTLTGYVPTPAARAEVAALARSLFAGATIEDRVRVAAGEPRLDWVGAIKFAMAQLARLGRGSVALGGKAYSIDGEAANSQAFVAIADTNSKTLPAGLELRSASVAPPRASPFRFVAERRGGTIAIGGFVASEDDRQQILGTARRKFGRAQITDELVFASGAPRAFVAAAGVALQALSRLAGGRVTLVDQVMSVSGTTFYPAAVEEVAEGITDNLPDGYTIGSNSVSPRQDDQPVAADRCRDMLQAALQAGRIEFDEVKSTLAADSFGALDRISSVVARCPDANIEVGAHSDGDGSAPKNKDRTQSRAETIVDYLVNAGVKRERLTAVGYGETKPIADNNTAQGKAANRRIEFSVAAPSGG
jgi:outer membrane protein OmpA-like peptidoglycan-associated protein